MKILYYDCFAGISGDMNLGALLDLGVNQDYLLGELKKLACGEYEIRITRDVRKGIKGTKFEVIVNPPVPGGNGPVPPGRTLRDISRIIGNSNLSAAVKKISLDIFARIAEAEGKIHGCKTEDVHFHEIGAVDSIVDIVGAAVCLDYLRPDRIMSSPVEVGGGFVRCEHGILPVPAPATMEILQGIPVKAGAIPFETTTPTGAAILAATVHAFTEKLSFTPQKIGYGIGYRETDIPNVLRAYLGEQRVKTVPTDPADDTEKQAALLVECNIDDMNPEMYEDVMDALLAKGAYDVFLTPLIMKKSRPAVQISVLCSEQERPAIEEIFWLRTSTFGLRCQRVSRSMLSDFSALATKFGALSIKNGYWQGRKIKSKAEYEDCRRLAKENGVSVKEVNDLLLFTGNAGPNDQDKQGR